MASTYNPALVAHSETILELSPLAQRLWCCILHSPALKTCGLMVWTSNSVLRLAAGMRTKAAALNKAADELASHGLVALYPDDALIECCHVASASLRLKGKVRHGALNEMRHFRDTPRVAEVRGILESGLIQPRYSHDTATIQPRTPAPAPALKKKTKKTAARFVPPTRTACEDYSDSKGWGRAFGAEFFDYFTADADAPWIDSKGSAVKSWKQKMVTHSRYRATNRNNEQASAFKQMSVGEQADQMNRFYRR